MSAPAAVERVLPIRTARGPFGGEIATLYLEHPDPVRAEGPNGREALAVVRADEIGWLLSKRERIWTVLGELLQEAVTEET